MRKVKYHGAVAGYVLLCLVAAISLCALALARQARGEDSPLEEADRKGTDEAEGGASFSRIGGTHTELIEKELSLQSGGSLSLRNANGSIDVSSWDKPEVHVRAEKKMVVRRSGGFLFWGGSLPFRTVEEAEDFFNQLKIEVSGDDRELVIQTHYPKNRRGVNLSVVYNLRVPREVNLNLSTSNGKVSVEGVQGNVKIRSSNGELSCSEISGEIDAETSNGKVSVKDTDGSVNLRSSNGSVSCRNVSGSVVARTSNGSIKVVHPEPLSDSESITCNTSNGSIELSLPEGSAFSVEASTSVGRISSDFPVTVSGRLLRKRLSATVGEGGPKVKLTTSNGSISIREVRPDE